MTTIRDTLDELQRAVDKGEEKPTNLIEKARRLLERNGDDAVALITQLMGENFDMRVKRRDIEQRLPKEGTVVLTAEEAKTWEALKGYDPADLTKKLGERDTFENELKTTTRQKAMADAARVAKMNPAVLTRLAGDSLVIEVQGEGDKAVVVVKDDKGVSTPLADYAKANWAEFGPALAADPKTQGVDWVNQGGGSSGNGKPPTTNAVDERIKAHKERAKAPNALRPAATGG